MIDFIKTNDIFNKMSQLPPEKYNFKDCLLPVAINNYEVTAEELVEFWKLWQHFGENQDILAQAFFDGRCPQRFPQDINELIQLIKRAAKFMMDSYHYIEMQSNLSEEEESLIEKNLSSLEKKFAPIPHEYTKELKQAQDDGNHELTFYYFFLNKYVNGDYYKESVKSISNWPKMAELHANPIPGSSAQCIETKFRELRSICNSFSISIDETQYFIGDIYGILYQGRSITDETKSELESIAKRL